MRTTSLLSILSLTLLAGCGGAQGGSGTDSASAAEALDANDSTTSESAVLMASTDGTESSASASAAATTAAGRARGLYQPAGCVTATAVANVVTYTLVDCSGPWGLAHVTGTVVVTYTADAAGIHAAAVTTGLSINGATMNATSNATYTVNGSAKKLVVQTQGSGVGAFGTSITRNGSYTLSWDDASMCGALDGAWSTMIGNDTWSTSISNSGSATLAMSAKSSEAHVARSRPSGVGTGVAYSREWNRSANGGMAVPSPRVPSRAAQRSVACGSTA